MIRNEVVSITANGTPIYPSQVLITCGVGRGYNVASFSGINVSFNVGDIIVVTINSNSYTFLVDKKEYGKSNKVSATCVGLPAQLSDFSKTDESFNYIDSDTLITESKGSISVVNSLPNITFENLTYNKSSTPLSRIIDIVNVFKGDVYEHGSELYLEEKKAISSTPTIAHTFIDSEIFDFAYSDNRSGSSLLQEVLFNPTTDDLSTETFITFDYDESVGKGVALFNPSLSLNNEYFTSGLDVSSPMKLTITENIDLAISSFIVLKAGVDSVLTLKINGSVKVEDTDFFVYAGYNIIRLNTSYSGTLTISYITKGLTAFARNTTNFTISYGCSIISDEIRINPNNIITSTLCYTEILTPLTYDSGGSVLLKSGIDATFVFSESSTASNLVTYDTIALSGGGTLTVEYVYLSSDWVSKAWMNNITSEEYTDTVVFTGEVTYDGDLDEYVVFLDKPISSINDIYFGSEQLSGYSYNDTGDVPYISFVLTDEWKNVNISVEVLLTKVNIPAPEVGHPVKIIDVLTCGGMATKDFDLAETTLCSLPSTFKLSISELFNFRVVEVRGKVITGDFGEKTVDSFGNIEITVSTQGIFNLDCSNIKSNGNITINSEGVPL